MDKKDYLENKISGLITSPASTAAENFLIYADMLVERNKVVNLTAITDFEDIVTKHFVDSIISLSSNVSRETLKEGASVIDVGTGAGFPGLPLKIARPDINLTLVDALRKRCDFLEDVCRATNLEAEVIHARAEDAARYEDLRGAFDVCVSRAVADLRILSEYCLPFAKVGGVFIAYKAADCEEELRGAENAIMTLGGKLSHIETLMLPDSDIQRKLIIIEKTQETPEKYPRRAGIPDKKPL